MKKNKTSVVSETNVGIYVWMLPDNTFVAEGLNVLNIEAVRGDIKAMSKIQQAAKFYGYPEGQPVFLEGRRQVTDEEFAIQLQRMKMGLTPDTQDIGVCQDEMRRNRK